jgi:hypothetical protein
VRGLSSEYVLWTGGMRCQYVLLDWGNEVSVCVGHPWLPM